MNNWKLRTTSFSVFLNFLHELLRSELVFDFNRNTSLHFVTCMKLQAILTPWSTQSITWRAKRSEVSEVYETRCSGLQIFLITISIQLTGTAILTSWSTQSITWRAKRSEVSEVHKTRCSRFQTFVITISIQLTVTAILTSWSTQSITCYGKTQWSLGSSLNSIFGISDIRDRNFNTIDWNCDTNFMKYSFNKLLRQNAVKSRKFMKLDVRDFRHSWSQFQYNWMELRY